MAVGRFLTFEGGEGAGKSTQARLLADRLDKEGVSARITREPGGTPFAEDLRRVLLSGGDRTPLAETLLFYAARADHLAQLIRPALGRGEWVICDRFSDSTHVYQGVAGTLDASVIEKLEDLVVGGNRPDMTIILDLDPNLGLARAMRRRDELGAGQSADRFEDREIAYHVRLRQGFLDIASGEPERCHVVDANRPADVIGEEIWSLVSSKFFGA